jgi:hypothetical protein
VRTVRPTPPSRLAAKVSVCPPPMPTLRAMKEDVLEQIVDDYLQFEGYFTIHNVRFRPRPDDPEYRAADDSVPSDVDVVGYHPTKEGRSRVVVVSCKSWQGGFDATAKLAEQRT